MQDEQETTRRAGSSKGRNTDGGANDASTAQAMVECHRPTVFTPTKVPGAKRGKMDCQPHISFLPWRIWRPRPIYPNCAVLGLGAPAARSIVLSVVPYREAAAGDATSCHRTAPNAAHVGATPRGRPKSGQEALESLMTALLRRGECFTAMNLE